MRNQASTRFGVRAKKRDQLGRFPFRNKALGRQSTPEEIAYMREQEGRVF